jgi:hypothetical protein
MLITADMALGPAFLAQNGTLILLLFVAISLIEAIALWRIEWAPLTDSLSAAFMANIASTLVGVLFSCMLAGEVYDCINVLDPVDHTVTGRACSWRIPPLVILVMFWAFSVCIEAGVLIVMKRDPTRRPWRASVVMNVISYVLLAGVLAFQGVS